MANELDIKKMPAALEAEKCIIGSMIQDNSCIVNVAQKIVDEDFYSSQYQILYRVILDMEKDEEEIDLVSLQEKLKTKNVPVELYSVEFLKSLVELAIPTNINNYCKIVKEKSNLRNIINVLSNASKRCYEAEDVSDDILESAEQELFDIQKKKIKTSITDTAQIGHELLDKISFAAKMNGGLVGVPSGFKYLDKTLSGFQKQNLIILAARTAMGKTSFALNVATNIALESKRPVAIFSLEMSRVEILARMVSMSAIIPSKTIREGSLKEEEWSRLIRDLDRFTKSKLIIDDTPSITIQELRAKCRQIQNTRGLDMVIIDYLQLMRFREKPLDSRQQEVAEISRSLKALAKELDIPIMALAQVSRSAEQRDSKKPLLSDLRESGSIEQDADVVLFIHRPGYYQRDNQQVEGQDGEMQQTVDQSEAEIIIAKHRNGETGSIQVKFEPTLTRFYDLDRYTDTN